MDIIWIRGERTIKKAARLRDMARSSAAMDPRQTLKKQVHRIGIGRLFGPAGLDSRELIAERICQTPNDLILHVEEIGQRLVEPLRPKMTARLGVDRLRVYVKAVLRAIPTALRRRERSVVRLSVTPSTKCSCSGSPPILANGKTTIERRGGPDFSGAGIGEDFACADWPTSSE